MHLPDFLRSTAILVALSLAAKRTCVESLDSNEEVAGSEALAALGPPIAPAQARGSLRPRSPRPGGRWRALRRARGRSAAGVVGSGTGRDLRRGGPGALRALELRARLGLRL